MNNDLIFQIADFQTRNTSRHKEFELVAQNTVKIVEKLQPRAVVFAGDLFHAKLILSPESVSINRWLLRSLAEITKTIVIPGNHDFNLSVKDRMDAISVIIEDIKNPNLLYYKASGLYKLDDEIMLGIFSMLDDRKKYPMNITRQPNMTYVGIYHGTIKGSKNEFGYTFDSEKDTLDMFDGYDMLLAGDIHKRQVMQKYSNENGIIKPTVAYCGSLVQQDIGEGIDKGALVWDIKSKDCEFVPIKNDYSFVKITSEDLSGMTFSKYVHLKYVSDKELNEIDKAKIEKNIREQVSAKGNLILSFDIEEVSREVTVNINNDVENIYDINVQNKVLKEYLTEWKTDPWVIDKCVALNELLNQNINKKDFRKFSWEPELLTFSNFSGYGEGNVVDFTKLRGITGIFANNTMGKSTLFNALYYAIYGEPLNDTPEYKLINHFKDTMHLEVILNVGGVKYHIERDVRRKGIKATEYDVEITNLNNPDDNTCKGNKNEIKKFLENTLGSYKDFKDTALSKQFDIQSVVCSTPTNRAKLLIKLLGLEVFDALLKLATPRYNEMKGKIKSFNKDKVMDEFSTIQDTIRKDTIKLEDTNTLISNLDDEISLKTNSLVEIQKLVKTVRVPEIDVNIEKRNIEHKENEIKNKESEIVIITLDPHNPEDLPKIQENLNVLKKAVDDIGGNIHRINTEKHNAEKSIQVNKSKVKEYKNDSTIIDEQPWCRETDLCKKCMFLEKAFTKESLIPGLESDNIAFEQYMRQKNDELEEQEIDKKIIADKIKEFEARLKKDSEHQINTNRITLLNSQIDNLKLEIENIKKKISDYEVNQKTILENKLYMKQSSDVEREIFELKDTRLKSNNDANNLRVALKLNAEKIINIDKQIKEFELMEKEYIVYETYYHAVHRDGIPKSIVTHYTQLINSTIANMIKNVVDWQVNLVWQDDDLLIMVKEKSGLEYAVEQGASGMQITVIGIAFRATLVLTSRIAKCKMLMLDECLGTLDPDMLGEIPKLFLYLKGLFKNILLISHVPIYDICDNLLIMSKEDGFSKVIQQ